jgi:NAD(P)-dependent dehydrogenase (short-subunit alcohol dehydrogenase family)
MQGATGATGIENHKPTFNSETCHYVPWRAVAERFAAEGASVAVGVHSNLEAAETTLRHIEAAGGRGVMVQGDVADLADARRLVDEAVAGLGGLDTLVLNAGIDDLSGPTEAPWAVSSPGPGRPPTARRRPGSTHSFRRSRWRTQRRGSRRTASAQASSGKPRLHR